MTNRPTQSPLTGSERTTLDDLIRRGAGFLNSAERNRLLRILQADRADREQERRTVRGMDKANQVLRRQLKDAEARLAAPCTDPVPPSVSTVYSLGPCIATGPHVEHRNGRGASWRLTEEVQQ